MNDAEHLERRDRERRFSSGVELRGASDAQQGPGMLVGYPVVFNSPSEVLKDKKSGRAFREVVKPGAVARTLLDSDIRALVDHDPGKVIGRNKAGTLRVSIDARGVRAEIDLPDTTVGRDCAVSVARGDITGMSFGFCVPKGGDSWDLSGDMAVRHLHCVDIDDFSLVAYPAYPDTEVAMRSLDQANGDDVSRGDDGEPPMPSPAETSPDPDKPEPLPDRRAEIDAEIGRLTAERDALEPPADPTDDEAPGPDPEAARQNERDRDRLKMLGLP